MSHTSLIDALFVVWRVADACANDPVLARVVATLLSTGNKPFARRERHLLVMPFLGAGVNHGVSGQLLRGLLAETRRCSEV